MTLRFIDGFDHYTPATVSRKWTVANTTSMTNITGVNTRFSSGQAVQFAAISSAFGKVLDAKGVWIIGFAMKIVSINSSSAVTFLQIDDGTTAQLNFGLVQSDRSMTIRRGGTAGTIIGTAPVLPNNTWFYLEIKVVIHPTAGSVVVRVNGVVTSTISGVNTSATGSSVASGISFGDTILIGATSQCTNTFQMDDMYICDGSGTTNNDFLGDMRVETLYPSGIGTASQWVPHGAGINFNCVSGVVPDDDTTYVETTTPGNTDTYQLDDLSGSPAHIYGVQANLLIRKTDAGSRFISEAYRIGSTVYIPAVGSGLSVYDGYAYGVDIQEINPLTATQWATADINQLEAGIQLVS